MLEIARHINDKRILLPDGHGIRLPPNDAGKISMRGYALEANPKIGAGPVPTEPTTAKMDTSR